MSAIDDVIKLCLCRCARRINTDVKFPYLNSILFEICTFIMYLIFISVYFDVFILSSSLCYKNFCLVFFRKIYIFFFQIHFAE